MNQIMEKLNKTIGNISTILVPLFFSLSELFHPITMDTPVKEILSAHQYSNNWLIAHIFALLSLIFVPFLIIKLIDYIDKKYHKFIIFPFCFAFIGTILTTGLLTFDFVILDMSKIGPTPDIINLYSLLNDSIYGIIFLKTGPIIFLLGLMCLVTFMIISTLIKKWKSILILTGLIIYGLAGPLIPLNNAHILVNFGAIIMLIGFIFILLKPSIKK